MRKGFTLVELSIVLVIIGLLIGGILVAQSMIATARINSAAQQIQQFDAGVMSFKARYNYLPGDAPGFGGNADHLIDATAVHYGHPTSATTFTCEIANFWNHLNPDEYASSVCSANGTDMVFKGAGKNVPLSKIGRADSYIVAAALTTDGGFGDLSNPSNYYFVLDPASATFTCCGGPHDFKTTTSANSTVTPADLLAFDKKIDDGIANSGIILSAAVGNYGGTGAGGLILAPLATCSSGADYEVENTGYECTPAIRIGGQAGSPQ